MSEFNIQYELANMVPAPAGVATPYVMYRSEDGILDCYGTTVPTDATDGFAIGCTFRKVDGGAGTALYVNEGTAGSCDFNALAGA
jgi:hypothetical protein